MRTIMMTGGSSSARASASYGFFFFRCWLLLLLRQLVCFSLLLTNHYIIVYADSNYHPYQYDLTIPQFTPDGRLLQVEYAQKSNQQLTSNPVYAIRLMAKNGENLLLLACCRNTRGQSLQQRLVVLSTPNNNNANKNAIVLALSGILADCLYILQKLQDEILQEHRKYGVGMIVNPLLSSAKNVAMFVARTCQQPTMGGGQRPFGSTIWIADCNNDNNLYQTDPSGGVQELLISSSNNDDDTTTGPTMMMALGGGGGTTTALETSKLQRQLEECVDNDIGEILQILLSSHQQRTKENDDRSSGKNDVRRTRKKTTDNEDDANYSKENEHETMMEVVLLSPTLGVTKLNTEQIDKLLERAARNNKTTSNNP